MAAAAKPTLPSSASSGHGLAATSSSPGSSSPSAHWRRAASSPGTSPPPRRTEEAAVGGLVRELEGGAGGWTSFVIADAEDDRWLAECWGRGISAHWVSAAGSVKPEPLEMGGGRQDEGEVQWRAHWRGEWEELRSSGHGRKGEERSVTVELSTSHLYKGGQIPILERLFGSRGERGLVAEYT
ncbi:hypothetical protein OsI_36701 [Oryza sativa Indica Group]|uniref:Uncharacterized protein n=1 Tax=Oryza sativa subsp. indica TaxID=39946 RepID=A2ZFZ5_ORYSI|nr:hypothetical protein OsI_36701 [Oryza sativa Indica Group]